ncbi:MAG: hypothetical protein WD045_07485 [Pirellulaceae bacterium]
MSFRNIWIGAIAAVCCAPVLGGMLQAADFQTTTEVFQGNSKSPLATFHTIFKDNVVYDISLNQPRQVTIFDFNAARLTLLDSERQVKLSLSTQDALELASYFKTHLKADLPILSFSRDPSFETSFDAQSNRLVLRGEPLTYQSTLQVLRDRAVVDDYARFCDFAAMVSFTCSAGHPPQARMELNNQMRSRSAVPVEIRKMIPDSNPANNVELRSRHEFRWKLDERDTQLIKAVKEDETAFKPVGHLEYVKPAK